MSNWSLDDTIVALATARGPSAISVVRVSGPDAEALLHAVTPDRNGVTPAPRRATLTTIVNPLSRDIVDRALVTWFEGPSSYTGEDSVEVATHGGALVSHLAVEAFLAAGARLALPGEFTRRALLNGKLDLLEAEAVLDLIEGTSPALHRAAIHQLEGGLSHRITEIRGRLIGLSAALAYGIDFPDEDEPPVPVVQICSEAAEARELLQSLLRTVPHGQLLRDGALVVLAGRPNSGKSSLFNALCGQERALVTEIPGTTRDAIDVLLSMDGFPVRLVDTAGLRETEDTIEALGIEVARRYLAGADLVILCAEASGEFGAVEKEFLDGLKSEVVIARTKADLYDREIGEPGSVRVSARTGDGLDDLRAAVVSRLFRGVPIAEDAPVVTRERHARALSDALAEIQVFEEILLGGGPAEIAAIHLAGSISALDGLIGRVDQEDVLDAVFSSFCVGK